MLVILTLYVTIGYWHAKQRIRKGLAPLAYHRVRFYYLQVSLTTSAMSAFTTLYKLDQLTIINNHSGSSPAPNSPASTHATPTPSQPSTTPTAPSTTTCSPTCPHHPPCTTQLVVHPCMSRHHKGPRPHRTREACQRTGLLRWMRSTARRVDRRQVTWHRSIRAARTLTGFE